MGFMHFGYYIYAEDMCRRPPNDDYSSCFDYGLVLTRLWLTFDLAMASLLT